MKIFAISDLHLSINNPKPMDIFGHAWNDYIEKITADWEKKVSDDDVVLIAGDISWAMKIEDAVSDLNFIGSLPGKKILIRGNHDYWWKSISAVRNICPTNVFALQNDCIQIGNYIFSGTRGWQLPDGKIKFTQEDKKLVDREIIRLDLSLSSAKTLKEKLEKENEETYTIVSLIHYPPFNAVKMNNEFTALFEKYDAKAVVYGHIHSYPARKEKITEINGVRYYLTSCDQIKNQLLQIF